MKRVLVAQLARFERQRRMEREHDGKARLALAVPGSDYAYGPDGASVLEISALSSLMLAKAYRRY